MPQPADTPSVAGEETTGATHRVKKMDISELGMGCLYILWTLLSYLIGAFRIERLNDNSYFQYVGGMHQTNENGPMDNSWETATWSSWVQRQEDDAREQYVNELAKPSSSGFPESDIMLLQNTPEIPIAPTNEITPTPSNVSCKKTYIQSSAKPGSSSSKTKLVRKKRKKVISRDIPPPLPVACLMKASVMFPEALSPHPQG